MARLTLAFTLVLVLTVPAFANNLTNGSFEDYSSGGTGWVSSIANWTLTPSTSGGNQTAGIFFLVNGFSASDGQTFSGLTNNKGGQAMSQGTFNIDNERIDFDWIYVTKNSPGDTVNKDPFTVTLITTGNLGNTSQTWTVSDADDSSLAQGTVGTAPWGSTTATYDTQGWQTFTIDLSNLQGQSATLVFNIADTSSQTGGVSGVFLDNVAQIPEPATFVLFGAGFLGLTLYGRYRRKRKK